MLGSIRYLPSFSSKKKYGEKAAKAHKTVGSEPKREPEHSDGFLKAVNPQKNASKSDASVNISDANAPEVLNVLDEEAVRVEVLPDALGTGGKEWFRRQYLRRMPTKRDTNVLDVSLSERHDSEEDGAAEDTCQNRLLFPYRRTYRQTWKGEALLGDAKPTEAPASNDLENLYKKYGGTFMGVTQKESRYTNTLHNEVASTAVEQTEAWDANELSSKALKCLLQNDKKGYEKYNALVIRAQNEGKVKRSQKTENVEILESVDALGRNRSLLQKVHHKSLIGKGKRKAFTTDNPSESYYLDDDVSFEELQKREKISGIEDYDANYAQYILRQGKRFRPLNEEDDEIVALGRYESKEKSMDLGAFKAKQRQKWIQEKTRLNSASRECYYCIDSFKFKRFLSDRVIAASAKAYICFQDFKTSVIPNHFFIAPVGHIGSVIAMEEDVYEDIRNFQKSLIALFDKRQEALIFIETVTHHVSSEMRILGGGTHTIIECFSLPSERLKEAKTYFKKAFTEAEGEWSDNKKLIEVRSKRGPRGAIPKGFPYIFVDFSLDGGMAHIIESGRDFSKRFGKQVIMGMLGLDPSDRAFDDKQAFSNALKQFKLDYKPYDWTQHLTTEAV